MEHLETAKILSMHRDAQQNALTTHLCDRLGRAVQNLERGSVTTFFILRGSQVADLDQRLVTTERDKYFCTGTDLWELREAWKSGNRQAVFDYYRAEAHMVGSFVNCVKPWAAGLDGTVMGAGAGLAMHAPFKLVSGAAIWALPETSYGAVPGYGED